MPTTYAHYSFGQEVKKHLKEDTRRIISDNEALYNIGLHGPDILFYYRPIGFNRINQTGVALHNTPGEEFIIHGMNEIKKQSENKAAIAYLFGFICHYMLDSECHPYINESNEALDKLYNDSIISTARLITEFYEGLEKGGPLSPRFARKFK